MTAEQRPSKQWPCVATTTRGAGSGRGRASRVRISMSRGARSTTSRFGRTRPRASRALLRRACSGCTVSRRDDARGSVWLDAGGAVLMLERAEPGEPSVARAARSSSRSRSTTDKRRRGARGVAVEAETAHTLYFRDPDGRRSASALTRFDRCRHVRHVHAVLRREGDRLVVARVGVADDPHPRVAREHALEARAPPPACRRRRRPCRRAGSCPSRRRRRGGSSPSSRPPRCSPAR